MRGISPQAMVFRDFVPFLGTSHRSFFCLTEEPVCPKRLAVKQWLAKIKVCTNEGPFLKYILACPTLLLKNVHYIPSIQANSLSPSPNHTPQTPPNWSKQGSVTVPITVVLDLYTDLLTMASDVVYWHQIENFLAMDVFKGEKHLETIVDVLRAERVNVVFHQSLNNGPSMLRTFLS